LIDKSFKLPEQQMPRKLRIALPVRYADDAKVEAGIDEAGRGSFWGPLMAGAVVWPREDDWTDEYREIAPFIQDSKTITERMRDRVAAAIPRLALACAVGCVEAAEIDEYGMTWANHTAFSRAVEGLSVKPQRLIIDGTLSIPFCEAEEQETVLDGDAAYLPIAAASVLAKTTHDAWVTTWCKKEENKDAADIYKFASNKGYGTAAHRRAINDNGLLTDHRKLFLKKGLKVPAPRGTVGDQGQTIIDDGL
jgi:ribonuclease HII